ncbi:MAG: hypothetical protein KY445_16090 [Armatimonadetes bacterium]|nr:hypothetical protein [Armatimonadota bacterium]
MNPTTQQIIEFLSHPELRFGGEEDVLLLADPADLQSRVALLLDESPAILGQDNSQTLKTQLAQADWPLIAGEFRSRIEMASGFFGIDAQSSTGA